MTYFSKLRRTLRIVLPLAMLLVLPALPARGTCLPPIGFTISGLGGSVNVIEEFAVCSFDVNYSVDVLGLLDRSCLCRK